VIRVAHVITRLDLGGAQDNTLHTVKHLRPPYAPFLVAGPGGLLDEETMTSGVEAHFVPSLVRPIRPWRDVQAVAALARLFRRLRPDIVHTHSSKAGIVGRAAAAAAGVPVVVHTIHGFGFHPGQGRAVRAALRFAERAMRPATTHVVAVSRAHIARGAALGLLDPARASVIRSGVHLGAIRAACDAAASRGTEAHRARLGLPAQGPMIGMVACLKPQKAPLDFVEAAARVARNHPEARFVLAGDGELSSAVASRARALGLEGRLSLLGWRRDVPDLLAALDVLVLTSRWEGLPRVIPEAIAATVPVVATAVDGSAEILKDDENGLLAEPGDIDGIAARIGRLLDDPALAPRLTAAARPLLEEFDIDRMVRRQEALYARLLDEKAHPVAPPAARPIYR
jgi:glycosyltransferase involved in cell wall biosynthesis